MNRRGVLLGAIAVAVSSKAAASNTLLAAGLPQTAAQRCARSLASALRSIGSDRCVAEAERLETLGPAHEAVALHLRKFGLGAADATLITGALERLTPDEAAALPRSASAIMPGSAMRVLPHLPRPCLPTCRRSASWDAPSAIRQA